MSKRENCNRHKSASLSVWLRAVLIALAAVFVTTGAASAETRTLKLYYIHTKEKKAITYKRNGKYLSKGLKDINRFLRDWRRNEPTKMDPQLLDLLWEAYRKTGSREYIHVVSAYRSPKTNAMLRRTRGGQARKSQHMLGKAIDFYIPGVKVSKLREIGFRLQGGGVGYYPKSGVPFVHLDTGNVRAWPRMSRKQLTRLFPNGRTLHLPPDGKPLPGYQQALAEYKRRKSRGQATATIGGGGSNDGRPKNLLAAIFGGGADEEEDNAETTAVASAAPARRTRAAASRPEPRPDTPGTLLAALPNSRMPVPGAAPRTNIRGVPVAIEPTTPPAPVETAPAEPQPIIVARAEPQPIVPAAVPAPTPIIRTEPAAPLPQAEPIVEEPAVAAYEPPVPVSRPRVLVAAAQPAPVERRTAAELEAALAAANTQAGVAVETANATLQSDDEQREAILAALQARPAARTTELAYAWPVPTAAPERPAAASEPLENNAQVPLPETLVAYAPPTTRPEPQQPLTRSEIAALSAATPATQAPVAKTARLPVPAARASNEAPAEIAALSPLDTDVRTTAKDARPTDVDAAIAKPVQTAAIPSPIEEIDPARFGTWTTASASLTDEGRADTRPDFIKNAQRQAPEVVYTSGFERSALPENTNSFSGTAVTFLSVAKFEGASGGGDGQPLQLQLPLTN